MSLFKVQIPVPLKADIVVVEDGFRSEEDAQVPADVTFRRDTNTFALLMYARLQALTAIDAGHFAVDGDGKPAEQFSRWFKGI